MMRKIFILSLILLAFSYGVVGAQQSASDYAVYSTGQMFSGGVMLWRSDTGFIWALTTDGRVFNFPLSAYAHLSENRNRERQTYGPAFGFGKIWANNQLLRSILGNPIWQEVGFNMGVHQEGGTYYLRQTNGTIYQITPDNTWRYVEQMPTSGTPLILNFYVAPNPASPGATIALNWSIQGAEVAIIEEFDVTNNTMMGTLVDLPTYGGTSVNVPVGSSTQSIQFTLYAANHSDNSEGYEKLLQSEVIVPISDPVVYENNPGATYQQFERGFMIWRADTNDIYVLYDAGGQGANGGGPYTIYTGSEYAGLPNNPISSVPMGRVRPDNGFGKVWGNIPQVRNQIGWATQSEDGYLAAARLENYIPVSISVPDGRTVYLNPSGNSWSWVDTLH